MAKKTKVGKQRKDKFYKLAKETGFRSRASFKLIQLNRKFEFLPKSRVLIDLCAAPGGWLQVAQQAMPVSSIIIGVDLVPIKPIANVITIQEDITTDRCRQLLKKQLTTWKADIVLNDGAPNLGKHWIQDAFSQNQLTLSALKLGTEFLVKGGWFITKVFRSKDYLSLVWVFKKLFKHVHVTKPQASRNESAEIFVVCQGFLAPDRIDPKFLDPAHMFKDVPQNSEAKTSILEKSKKKPKAEGYDDDDASVFSALKATDFIFCENHVERLGKCTKIVLDDADIKNHKLTTNEVKQCCEDIKVLGKAEIRLLLTWRKQLLESIKGAEEKQDPSESHTKEINEDDEVDAALKAAEEVELAKLQEAKKRKKKILKERKKLHDRLNLKMIIKDDVPIIEEDRELFRLTQIKDKKDLSQIEDETNLEFSLEPQQPELDDLVTPSFRHSHIPYYRDEKQDDYNVEENEKAESLCSSDEGLSSDLEFESGSEKEEEQEVTETILKGEKNPLMVDLVERTDRVQDTVEKWFDKEDFADLADDNDLELDLIAENFEIDKLKKDTEEAKMKKRKSTEDESEIDEENASLKESMGQNKNGEPKSLDDHKNTTAKKKKEKKKKRVKLDPEGLALGSLLIQSKKMKRDIIESGYNMFASNDENLPDWFLEDEKKHYKKQLPVTAEMVAEYKQRLREINARPIKKVVEAKARKKRRAMRRMEKARKRAEKVTEHPDMGVQEKAEQLKEIYKKALPREDKNVTYVVAKKGVGRRVRRPGNVKGRFKVVDKRMKKDMRKEKMTTKSQKSGKPQKKGTSKHQKKGTGKPQRKGKVGKK